MVRANEIKTSGSVTLDYIVKNLKNRQKVFNQTDYFHLLQLVIDATSYLNNITMDTIEVAYIPIGDTNAIELPSDYLDYTKIGFVDGTGRKWTLTLNKELVRFPLQECGLPLDKVLAGHCELFPDQFPIPNTGYSMGTSYAVGGGFNVGYYNIDRQGRYLLISGLPKGTVIVLEYKSTGVKLGSTTYVARQALEAIIAWVMMTEQDYGNIQSSKDWTRKFKEEEGLLSNLEYTRTFQEHLDGLYREWHQGAKR